MIYNNNFFTKELKLGYIENDTSKKRQLGFGVFLGLCAFAFYFLLQTLENTIVADVAPELMYTSYFSILYIYVNLTVFFYVIYLLVYYEYLTFAEIIRNRWYTLVKMGYNPISMILTKISTRLLSIIFVYTLGFIVTVVLTSFLKFPFVGSYLVSLYVVGLIDMILITIVIMTISLFIKNSIMARQISFAVAILVFAIKNLSGYFAIISDRELMKSIWSIFDFSKSLYLVLVVGVLIACLVVSIIKAKSISKYYNFPYYKNNLKISKDIDIVICEDGKDKWKKSDDYIVRKEGNKINVLINTILFTIIAISILINSFILLVSLSSADKEITIFGYIPYVFQSETMEPQIKFNDLAFFSEIDQNKEIKVDDVVLYERENIIGVSRVREINEGSYLVDIDNYGDSSKGGTYKETIQREDIYGMYASRSRWLGALILFANSTIGRVLFLLIPTFMIFFYKQIGSVFKELFKGGLKV